MRVLELYAGIGGCAVALDATDARIVAAVEQSRVALDVYRANFPHHPTIARRVDDLGHDELESLGADLWWASPPCQPFTVRGRRRDLDDPRAETFLALLRGLEAVRPRAFVLENVAGFVDSRAHARLLEVLERSGYLDVEQHLLCPSSLGWPNRRPRVYIVASRTPLPSTVQLDDTGSPSRTRLADLIDETPRTPALSMRLEPALARRYASALHLVERDDDAAVTTCFTAAYGRSPVRSGSYLLERSVGGESTPRHFSPAEVLRLLGFPADFELLTTLARRKAWHLAGNSLSVPAVRAVLSRLPALTEQLALPRRVAPTA
ncbi:MAG: DNA cytosine methyltransferase [Acidobacteriota bacterium]